MGGRWKNFEFKAIEEEDYPEVFKHFRDSFYNDEPTQKIVGTSEERRNDLDNRIHMFLQEKMSFMAICKLTQKVKLYLHKIVPLIA
jgi:hypothetical protein